jgi:hypothetical protein
MEEHAIEVLPEIDDLAVQRHKILFDNDVIKEVVSHMLGSIRNREKGWQGLATSLLDKWYPNNIKAPNYTQQNTLITDKKIYNELKQDMLGVMRGKKNGQ